ncbi:hypothetical protein [Rhodanobacter sp. C06]|nr:hypothetical protein [Rhodanobacter sp. C06]
MNITVEVKRKSEVISRRKYFSRGLQLLVPLDKGVEVFTPVLFVD